ncbi:MAG TPA: TetR/AcrR family transcriptional regulator [Deltaproteobacteria bacterium]|nr:TetR/AcrR family transcriptional regulator [Deltaproteobacteria bacterium]
MSARRKSAKSKKTEIGSRKAKSNRSRTEATRGALLEAARHLFAEKGFADTGTPEIVAAAGVTRGALYHHFIDKLELFRCVIEGEASRVAEEIARETFEVASPLDGMLRGADAYFRAMSRPGRARLLLLEGPAVLGVAEMDEIDRRTGRSELREGLVLALGDRQDDRTIDALAAVLSAAFDKAALAIASGEPAEEYKDALRMLATGIPGMTSEIHS